MTARSIRTVATALVPVAVLAAACGRAPRGGDSSSRTATPGVLYPSSSMPSAPPSAGTEDERRAAIVEEVTRADARARQEAETALPDPSSDSGPALPGSDVGRNVRQNEKRAAMVQSLMRKYHAQIAQRYGISPDQLQALLRASAAASPTPSPAR